MLGVLWGLMAVSRDYPAGARRPGFRQRPAANGLNNAPLRTSRASVFVPRPALAERSAARLAHQSGGLGVPSSNLGAPTNTSKQVGFAASSTVWNYEYGAYKRALGKA